MSLRRLIAPFLLCFCLVTTTDLWGFTGLDSVFQWTRPRTIKPLPSLVGSSKIFQGQVVTAKISYLEDGPYTSNARCDAGIVTDDQKTIRAVADPRRDVRPQEPEAMAVHFFQETVCDMLQTAFSEGWTVSVTATVTKVSPSDPTMVTDVAITRIDTGPSSTEEAQLGTAPESFSCDVSVCSAGGTVFRLSTDVFREDTLCQAAMRVDQNVPTPRNATIVVAFVPFKAMREGLMDRPEAFAAFHAKHAACAGLLDSMARAQAVKVAGSVSGSTITLSSFERPPAVPTP